MIREGKRTEERPEERETAMWSGREGAGRWREDRKPFLFRANEIIVVKFLSNEFMKRSTESSPDLITAGPGVILVCYYKFSFSRHTRPAVRKASCMIENGGARRG